MGSPILLSAVVPSLAPGSTREITDVTEITNPSRKAMWLDEIRFWTPTNSSDLTTSIRVQIHLGRKPLTSGFVPICLLGKCMQEVGGYAWTLAKPLYIPAGEHLRVAFFYSTALAGAGLGAIAVRVVLVGHRAHPAQPVPRRIQVPWAAAYLTPVRLYVDASDFSTEADIINPFDVPLNVQRFTGWLDDVGSSRDGRTAYTAYTLPEQTLVRAADSEGRILVRDPTPFNALFDFMDKTWTVNTVLKPHGFYLFQVDRNLAAYSAQYGVSINNLAAISMLGYREESL